MSKHSVPASDVSGLLLQSEGIESHVVDAASILTSRRGRRAKTDRIDGETLVRTLMAFKRGEPRVCSMARASTPQEEDRRRVCRERRTLVGERVRHVNRIKGLLFAQGVFGYEPLRKRRRERLEDLRTGDGRPLPVHLKAQIIRELDRLEVVLAQLKSVAAERDALLKPASEEMPSPPAMLVQLKGIGPETAADLGAQPVVPRAGPAPWWADAQDDHRRLGAQAPCRPVAVHDCRRRHRGGRDEGGTGDNLTPSART